MPAVRGARFGRGFVIPNLSKFRYGRRVEVAPGRYGSKFYFRDSLQAVSGTPPGAATLSTAAAMGAAFAGEGVNRALDFVPGSTQQAPSSSVLTTKAALARRFVSKPLAAQTIPQAPWQLNLAIATTGGGPAFVSFGVYVWRPSNGTKVATIVDDGGTGIGGVSVTAGSETPVTVNLLNYSFVSGATVLDGDVLVVEVYVYNNNAGTQTITVYYDGTTEGSATSNAATFVAPVVLAFLPQKFYLHAAAASSGPTAEQSAANSDASASVLTPKAMDSSVGASQATVSGPGIATVGQDEILQNWVSSPLDASAIPGGQIDAGTWSLQLALSNAGSNRGDKMFAVVYVWRPSNTSVVGYISDPAGSSATTDPNTGTETATTVTFSGSAVAVQTGDVLVIEIWAHRINVAGTITVYYDGTTEGGSSSNAAFLSPPAGVFLAFQSTVVVGISRILPYTLNVVVGGSRILPYTVIAQVGASRILPYTVAALAGGSRVLPYTVNALVGGSRILPYTVYAPIGASRILPYTVLVSVGDSRALVYQVTVLVGASRAQPYVVNALAGDSRALPYGVTAAVGTSRILPCVVASLAGASRAQPYTVLVLTGSSRVLPYTVVAFVGTSRVLPYTVAALAGASRVLPFTLAQLAGDSRALPYTVAALAGISRAQPYTIIAFVGTSRVLPYGVAGSVGTSRILPYTVATIVGGSRALPYGVAVIVGASRAQPYTVYALAGASRALPYGLAGSVGASRILPYTVLRIVGLVGIDTFSRVTANGWGTADSGGAWTVNAGVASEFSTDGALAKIATAVLNSSRFVTLPAPADADLDFKGRFALAAVPGGAASLIGLVARYVDTQNHYRAWLNWTTGGAVQLRVEKIVGGSITVFTAQPNVITGYTGGSFVWVRFQVVGNRLRAKAWADGSGEPTAWTVETTDPANAFPSAGRYGVRLFHTTGSTNNPTLSVDDLTVQTPVQRDLPYTVTTVIGSSRAQPYTVYQLAGASRILPYSVAAFVGASRALLYNVGVFLGTSRVLPYVLTVTAGTSRAQPYVVYMPVGASRAQPYIVYMPRGASRALPFTLTVAIGASRSLPYSLSTFAAASRAMPYALLTFAGTSRTLRYEILVVVGGSRALPYEVVGVLAIIGTSRALPFNLLLPVGTSRVLRYLIDLLVVEPLRVQVESYATRVEVDGPYEVRPEPYTTEVEVLDPRGAVSTDPAETMVTLTR